ncbi:DUF2513 domain-containing protein [Acinetobacter lactucae]|uniref:DUF2513 domain-containing protein n=1 Tax=Acinetobacter lactucae TaxID=1785128 RepID=UPI001580E169|nr:DUF2513 domain-containing protein [Acinetobacter lactucae]NUG23974.1 DUF2513 domain-containing protein [Acinetobacter lactucae]
MVKHTLVNKNDKLNVLSNLEISMKRDWDVIRAILIATEEDRFDEYLEKAEDDTLVLGNTTLLIEAGFITGKVLESLDGVDDVFVDDLTWQGHELLDVIRSKPVWEKIKATALEKGLELTFDVVKALGSKAISFVLGE